MQMLGPDNWWAPRWMKRVQERIGMGEAEIDDEPELLVGGPAAAPAGARAAAPAATAAAVAAGPATAVGVLDREPEFLSEPQPETEPGPEVEPEPESEREPEPVEGEK